MNKNLKNLVGAFMFQLIIISLLTITIKATTCTDLNRDTIETKRVLDLIRANKDHERAGELRVLTSEYSKQLKLMRESCTCTALWAELAELKQKMRSSTDDQKHELLKERRKLLKLMFPRECKERK